MKSNGKVDLEPEPFCRLKYFSASSIDFFANCWCDSEDYWDVYYYVIENVYNEFKRNNISIPYNQLEIRNRVDEVVMPVIEKPLQERVEKVRVEEKHKFNLETDGLGVLLKNKSNGKKKILSAGNWNHADWGDQKSPVGEACKASKACLWACTLLSWSYG